MRWTTTTLPALATILIGSGLVSLSGDTPTALAMAADPQVPVAQVLLNRPVYDRYEPVIVDLGVIGFFPSCPDGGVRDYIYPWADIYVVKGQPAVGALTDVSGSPNTVAGFGGGGFFDEVIGYAGVAGLQPSGSYSIVVDECQDGQLDFNDSVFEDIFRVTTRTSVDPLLGITQLKNGAGARAVAWEKRGRAWTALLAMEEALGYAAPFLTNPPLVAVGIGISTFLSKQASSAGGLGAFPNPKKVAAANFTNMGRHYRGLEADPPDPNYAQLTILGEAVVAPAVFDDPIFESQAQISKVAASEEVLTEALLHAIERYQGAEAQGDGVLALQHARQAQDFAVQLAAHLRSSAPTFDAEAAALEADARPIDQLLTDIGGAVDDVFANGLSAEQEAFLARSGVTRAELTVELNALDRLNLPGLDVAAIAANLRELATTATDFADDLDDFVSTIQGSIDALVANTDVFVAAPSADAGGPYLATVGTPLNVNASASAAGETAIASYEWDLDGDGSFDDANGATATHTPAGPVVGTVGVLVTGADGESDVAYAQLVVNGSAGVSITSSSPIDDLSIVEIGTPQLFEFVPSTGAVEWFIDGNAAGSGTTLSYAPTLVDAGAHAISAVANAGGGQGVSRDWTVQAEAPDADGDGYPSNLDCDDNDVEIYPGAPELLDGKDNDCNPASPDGGVAPGVDAGNPTGGVEGGDVALDGATITAAGATAPFTATVGWGDGTSTAASISGSDVTATHMYDEDGTYPIELCVTSATGLTACDTTESVVTNVAPSSTFATLLGWTSEELPGSQGSPNWVVADDGLSVLQTQNSRPSFFISDVALAGTEASVSIAVETSGDDDFIGFVVGAVPGITTDPNARYLLVDWKQRNQGFFSCSSQGTAGIGVSLVTGIPDDSELWTHTDCDDNGGFLTEIARGINFGSTGWAVNAEYRFRFVYTPTRFQMFVDEVLELDISSDLIVGDFPPAGNLGFYNYSQHAVRYSGFELTAVTATEGLPVVIGAEIVDAGVLDTHIGRFDFGDGTPPEAATIVEANGAGTATTTHTYDQDGDFNAELCVTDDEGAVACEPIIVRVANAGPVVDAGRDRVDLTRGGGGGPVVVLDDTTFSDLGILDTHTATIDWGDGSPLEVGVATSELGKGLVDGEHVYVADGTYTVTICVTDDELAEGCDSFDVEVVASNTAPVAQTTDAHTVVEGDTVEQGVGFLDANASDTQTVMVDWGDGAAGAANVQGRPGIGSGSATHVYADDGVYAAAFTVCDNSNACSTPSANITVTNADPIVGVDVATSELGATMTGAFTDPGTGDTHTVAIDWGDGAVESGSGELRKSAALTVGDGTVNATHTYASSGDYTVEVCVTDDDGGVGCATQTISVSGSQTATTTTTTTTTTTVTTLPAPATTGPPPPTTIPMGGLPATGNSGLRGPLSLAALIVVLGVAIVATTRRRSMVRR